MDMSWRDNTKIMKYAPTVWEELRDVLIKHNVLEITALEKGSSFKPFDDTFITGFYIKFKKEG